jgi:plastocyanin
MNTVRTRIDSWSTVTRAAAVVVAGCGVVVQVVLERSFIPPLTILDLALVGGAILAGPAGRAQRGRLIMGIASVAFVLLAVPFDLPHLAHPDLWLPFVIATTSVAGALVGVAGLIAATTGRLREASGRIAGTGFAVVAAAVIAGGLASSAAGSDPPRTGDLTVRAHDISFQPAEVVAPAGQISVRIDNRDLVTHTFAVDGLGVDITVPGGKARRVTFNAPAGRYRFRCTIAGHDNMKGTLVAD